MTKGEGNPSLRRLRAQLRKQGHIFGVSTLSDLISGRRPPSHELFATVIGGLLAYDTDRAQAESWLLPRVWLDAWSRAEYNRVRPDLTRRRRVGNIYLLSRTRTRGRPPGSSAS